MKTCIIIPMYNEEAVAQECLSTIVPYIVHLPGETEILVVDDGSSDKTQAIVKQFVSSGHSKSVHLISHPNNRGYGAATKTGVQFAIKNGYEYVIFMDSDLTNHPRYLEKFYEKMEAGFDYIKATRYAKGGNVEGVPWQRRVISFVGNLIARPAFRLSLTDFTNGFRAVKVDILKQVIYIERGFPVIMEELWQAKKLTSSFCEVPYTLTSRKAEQRITSFSYNWRTYVAYLKYVRKAFFAPRAHSTVVYCMHWIKKHILDPLWRSWTQFAEKVGLIMNYITLTIFYLLIVTPLALVRRMFRKDPLHLKWDAKLESYFDTKLIQPRTRFKNLF